MSPGLFRFLLASAVVITHYSSLNFGAAAVNLFFALSGYWVFVMWESKYSKAQRPYATFLISRVWRLAPVFLFCSMLALFVTVVLPAFIPASIAPLILTPGIIFSSLALLGYHTTANMPLVPAWSLDIELQFYILAPIMLLALKKWPKVIAMLIVVVGCLSSLIYEDLLVATFLPMFLIGMLAAKYPDFMRGKRKVIGSAVFILCVLVVFTAISDLRPVFFGGAHPKDIFIFNRLLNIFISLIAMPFALNTVFNKSSKIDKLLSDMSYSIYLFHWIPIIGLTYYFPALAQQPFAPRALLTAGIIVLTYVISYAITILIDRPMSDARARYVRRNAILPV